MVSSDTGGNGTGDCISGALSTNYVNALLSTGGPCGSMFGSKIRSGFGSTKETIVSVAGDSVYNNERSGPAK